MFAVTLRYLKKSDTLFLKLRAVQYKSLTCSQQQSLNILFGIAYHNSFMPLCFQLFEMLLL